MLRNLILLFLLTLPSAFIQLRAQNADTLEVLPKTPGINYTSKGFEFTSIDGDYAMRMQLRAQVRLSIPSDLDPATASQLGYKDHYSFGVNRAKLKVGGHAYKPWLKYYMEYELAASKLLDFRLMIEKYPWLKFEGGQWKVQYNRERIISSGRQQMMDRSLIKRFFTVDRQQGISVYGRLSKGGIADFNYWFSALNGTGLGGEVNQLGHGMYMSRLQWNIFGEPVPFIGSDLAFRKTPIAGLSLAGLVNRSAYTRFSGEGGGNLDGFPAGAPGQYGLRQFLLETALMYAGFSWQQEFHYKRIQDFVNPGNTEMLGNYIQGGYFFHYLLEWIPEALEFAFRYAVYDPDISVSNDLLNEYSFAFNWFFAGHKNKLTAEVDLYHFQQPYPGISDETQFSLQWDISF